MSNPVKISIPANLAEEASSVLERMGLDLEDAAKLFFRRCVLEQKLPFDMNAVLQTISSSEMQSQSKASGGKITQSMVEAIWQAFEKFHDHGGDLRSIADEVGEDTGMNAGSAFIYLVILDNLVKGQKNTRNMKMRDLEFYMERIESVYGPSVYDKAISSLEDSIPYWETQPLGNFAAKVKEYIRNHERKGQ